MTTNDTKDFLSPKDIQTILGISNGLAYELVHSMPHTRIGRCIRVKRAAFEQWIKEQERRTKIG